MEPIQPLTDVSHFSVDSQTILSESEASKEPSEALAEPSLQPPEPSHSPLEHTIAPAEPTLSLTEPSLTTVHSESTESSHILSTSDQLRPEALDSSLQPPNQLNNIDSNFP